MNIRMIIVDVRGHRWISDVDEVGEPLLADIKNTLKHMKGIDDFNMDIDGLSYHFNTDNVIAAAIMEEPE